MTPLLYCIKLCASFQIHQWIQIGVTVQKRPILVKIYIFFSRVTLQFEVWPWKTIGHFFYATSSFVHHFVAIGEFKLELRSGNAQFWSNWTIFRAVWPWTLMYDLQNNKAHLLCYLLCYKVNSNWSFSQETPNLDQICWFFELCDLELWEMTLKNNRAPRLRNIKLCASFHHHMFKL